MSRDAKVGLVIVFVFVFLFGSILVHRLKSDAASPEATANPETAARAESAPDTAPGEVAPHPATVSHPEPQQVVIEATPVVEPPVSPQRSVQAPPRDQDSAAKLILVGDCLKKYRDKGLHVEGCPPGEPAPHWAIVDRMTASDVDISDPEIFKLVRARMEEEAFPFIEHMIKLKAEHDEKHGNS